MIVTIVIILVLLSAAYTGYRRGLVLVAVELGVTAVSLAVALIGYVTVGGWLRSWFGLPRSMGELAGLAVLWMVMQLLLLVALWRRRRQLVRQTDIQTWSRYAGGGLNFVRGAITVALILIVFAALPLSASDKRPVTDARLPRTILADTGQIQSWLNHLFGQDLADTLTYLTVPNDPESTERIELGFTTTNVSVDPADENQMLIMVNRERTSRGLAALISNPRAQAVARAYGRDLLAHGYFSHISLEGTTPFQRMTAGGVKYGAAGENLALAPTLQLAHTGLMNSPGHRANILNIDYRTVGIGIIDAGQYGLMVVQDFTD